MRLLLPHTTALSACLDGLRPAKPVVYDVTLAAAGYSGQIPRDSHLSDWEALKGIIGGWGSTSTSSGGGGSGGGASCGNPACPCWAITADLGMGGGADGGAGGGGSGVGGGRRGLCDEPTCLCRTEAAAVAAAAAAAAGPLGCDPLGAAEAAAEVEAGAGGGGGRAGAGEAAGGGGMEGMAGMAGMAGMGGGGRSQSVGGIRRNGAGCLGERGVCGDGTARRDGWGRGCQDIHVRIKR